MTDADVLHYNPWGYDDSAYRVLRNQMLVTRVPSQCAICFASIPPGSRVRAQTEVLDGKAMTFKFCPACCEAMAQDAVEGDCLHIEQRTQIGMRAAGAAPPEPEAED